MKKICWFPNYPLQSEGGEREEQVSVDLHDDHNWHCSECFKRCEEVTEIWRGGYEDRINYSYRSGCCEATAYDLDDEEDVREWEEYRKGCRNE